MQILDGRVVAKARFERLKTKVAEFTQARGRKPGLAVVLVGEDPASQVYVRNKTKTCNDLGMHGTQINLPAETTQKQLEALIAQLNGDATVDGILVQLPLPKQFDELSAIETISLEKDADVLTTRAQGKLWSGVSPVAPCTPSGVMAILEHHGIKPEGLRAVVIGRSKIVGLPMANLLLKANATVTVCHSKTRDLAQYTREADLVVVAAGRERFIGRDHFKKGAVVVDVGMHRPTQGPFQGKLCGDVRYEELEGWASAATPVPGGVGPMTIQMLMENTFVLAQA